MRSFRISALKLTSSIVTAKMGEPCQSHSGAEGLRAAEEGSCGGRPTQVTDDLLHFLDDPFGRERLGAMVHLVVRALASLGGRTSCTTLYRSAYSFSVSIPPTYSKVSVAPAVGAVLRGSSSRET